MELAPGTIIDKLQVIELLGQGAMASVYLVRHVHLDAPYALKILQVHEPQVAERLLTEGRVQAALRHPNVVGVADVIRVGDRPGLVLEFVDGPTLETFIAQYGPLSLADVEGITLSVAKGLRAAHVAGHLHRDLKPANILMDYLDEQWNPKIADFGLAKLVLGDGDVSTTRTGQILGSPTFMAPEQFRDARGVDERADVFALGAVAYEIATQTRCFDGPDVVQVLTRIAAGAFVPVQDLRPELPMRIVSAIHGALVVDPAQRIPDVDTFMKVWRGETVFEANAQDVTSSVIGLLGADPALLSGTHVSPVRKKNTAPPPRRARVAPLGVLGSLLVLGLLAMVALSSLLAGGAVVYLLGTYGVPAMESPVEESLPSQETSAPPTPPEAPTTPDTPEVPTAPETQDPPDTPEPEPVDLPEPPPERAPVPVAPRPAPVEPRPEPAPPTPAAPFSLILLSEELGNHAPLARCVAAAEEAGEIRPGTTVLVTLLVGTDGTIVRNVLADAFDRGSLPDCFDRVLADFQLSAAPSVPYRSDPFPVRASR